MSGRHTKNTPEFFTPGIGAWRILETDVPTGPDDGVHVYPRMHLLPNGRLFRVTPIKQVNVVINPLIDSLIGREERNDLGRAFSDAPSDLFPTDFSYPSVVLPLTPAKGYQARVLLAGRKQPLFVTLPRDLGVPPCSIAPPGSPCGQWRKNAHRALARANLNATLLPTGEVFVSGGKSGPSFAKTRVLEGEIDNLFRDTWRVVAPALLPREYHSIPAKNVRQARKLLQKYISDPTAL